MTVTTIAVVPTEMRGPVDVRYRGPRVPGRALPKVKVSQMAAVDIVVDHSATGDGVADDSTPLANAISAAGDDGSVHFPVGAYLIDADVDCGSTTLIFERGAYIIVDDTRTLTVTGWVRADPDQIIFARNGSGVVDMTGRYFTVHPHWWSASTDDTPDSDDAQRWGEMWAAAPDARRIEVGAPMEVETPIEIHDSRDRRRIIDFGHQPISFTNWATNDSGAVIDVLNTRFSQIRHVDIYEASAPTNLPQRGVYCHRATSGPDEDKGIGDSTFFDVHASGHFTRAALETLDAERHHWIACGFTNARENESSYALWLRNSLTTSANGQDFVDCHFSAPGGGAGGNGGAILIENTHNIRFRGVTYVKSSGRAAITIDIQNADSKNVAIDSLWQEHYALENPTYAVEVVGNNSTQKLIDFFCYMYKNSNLLTAGVHIDKVKVVRGMTYRARSEGNGNYDVLVTERTNGPSTFHGLDMDMGAVSTCDLSAISTSGSTIAGRIVVRGSNYYAAPAGGDAGALDVSRWEDGVGVVGSKLGSHML